MIGQTVPNRLNWEGKTPIRVPVKDTDSWARSKE